MQSSLQSRDKFDLLKMGNPLLIDLSDVKFIDSTGIVSLVEGLKAAKSAKLNFGLLDVSPATMQVLTLTRLDRIFSIYNSADEFQQQL